MFHFLTHETQETLTSIRGLHQKKLVLRLLLPVLGATRYSRAKKAVVCMSELVAPFVPAHGSWTFLPDMNCLLDPSGRSIRRSVNYRCCRPTDHMILLDCVVC